jgi:hypothetical protein
MGRLFGMDDGTVDSRSLCHLRRRSALEATIRKERYKFCLGLNHLILDWMGSDSTNSKVATPDCQNRKQFDSYRQGLDRPTLSCDKLFIENKT